MSQQKVPPWIGPKTTRVVVRVTSQDKADMQEEAAAKMMSVSAYLRAVHHHARGNRLGTEEYYRGK